MPEPETALQVAIKVSYRHYSHAGTSESERDAILQAIIVLFGPTESEAADRILFHRREAAEKQLQLNALLEGIARGQV